MTMRTRARTALLVELATGAVLVHYLAWALGAPSVAPFSETTGVALLSVVYGLYGWRRYDSARAPREPES